MAVLFPSFGHDSESKLLTCAGLDHGTSRSYQGLRSRQVQSIRALQNDTTVSFEIPGTYLASWEVVRSIDSIDSGERLHSAFDTPKSRIIATLSLGAA